MPLTNGPSQVSEPEYDAVMLLPATSEADPVSVALHSGVGSPFAPAAKNIEIVSVVSAIVPVNVPRLLR